MSFVFSFAVVGGKTGVHNIEHTLTVSLYVGMVQW
jgi:hypothetical protein